MFALADANNFYASCERVFKPELREKPVVVLSNNDGCIVARSNEAKAMGIQMGTPFYQIKYLVDEKKLFVFSSNYTLYGDMSHRFMSILRSFVPDIEVYSIDEAFLDLRSFQYQDLLNYGKLIAKTVYHNLGIPISIGIAPTKTLAKVAAKYAKNSGSRGGAMMIETEEDIEISLRDFPIEDVWGIGRQYSKLLKANKIHTALEFSQCNREWIRKNFTVVGERTWNELHGISSFDFEYYPADKKQICTSHSFSPMISQLDLLSEAIARFAAICAQKLRKDQNVANGLLLFIGTNRHRTDLPQYFPSKYLKTPIATSNSSIIIQTAQQALKLIYKPDYQYKKAGVILTEIRDKNSIQGNLFIEEEKQEQKEIMRIMDQLNQQFGRETITLGAEGTNKKKIYHRDYVSPNYSTSLKNCIEIKL